MRIALLGSFPIYPYRNEIRFWNDRKGLTTTWNYNLAMGLARIPECDVHLLTNAPLLKDTTFRDGRLTIHFIGHLPKLNIWDYITQLRYSKWLLHKKINELKPDVVHGSGTDHEYAYAAVTSKYPNIFTIHGLMKHIVNSNIFTGFLLDTTFARYEKKVIRKGQNLIAISEYVLSSYPEFNGRIFRIPNAIDVSYFNGRSNTEAIDILFVGRINPRKRVLNIFKAASKLLDKFPLLNIKIVGGNINKDYFNIMNEYIHSHGLANCVEFVGRKEQSEVADLVSRCKVLVLPSIAETLPMVCAEASAAGKPVVASRVGGVPELVLNNETGILVEPDNVPELTNALYRILSDHSLRLKLGTNAKKRAANLYHPDVIAAKTLEAYREVVRTWK